LLFVAAAAAVVVAVVYIFYSFELSRGMNSKWATFG
jgi:hypothetical protein